MKKFGHTLFIALNLSMAWTGFANAQDIAFIAPMSGTMSSIGEDMAKGVTDNSILDSACDAETGANATQQALEGGARIIVGLPCVEALDAAASIVQTNKPDAVIIGLGVEVPDITSRERRQDWPVFRLAASASQEAETIATYLKAAWRGKNFAIIDDGTLYGRQLSETVRFLLETDNLKPVFTDNYRPLQERQSGLVRRIQKSGATHVFIGGDAYDAAIIGKDAADLGVNLQIVGGASFRAPREDGILPDGTIFVANTMLNTGDGDDALSHFATLAKVGAEIATQALDYANANNVALNLAMRAVQFDTSIGSIRFTNEGENDFNWFEVYKVEGGDFSPISVTN